MPGTKTLTPTLVTLLHTHIHPSSSLLALSQTPTSTLLSIPDAATAGYSPPQAIWFYDVPSPSQKTKRGQHNAKEEASESCKEKHDLPCSTDLLLHSLAITLDAYPHFAGKLEHVPFRAGPEAKAEERGRRLKIVFGGGVGVETLVVKCEDRLEDFIPSPKERGRCWNASHVPFSAFSGQDVKMALWDGNETEGLPVMIVKLTTFRCGGLAVAARLQHVLGDAQAFLRFVKDWAAVNRSLVQKTSVAVLEPVFDPRMLDRRAAGNVDAEEPDKKIMEGAEKLPVHQFDWWASQKNCPKAFLPRTSPHPSLFGLSLPSLGEPIPWHDWDNLSAPTPHYVLHITAVEISRLCAFVKKAPFSSADEEDIHTSKLDALLAHLWSLILRARKIPPTDPVYLNFAINFRPRLSPPLPAGLLGVPACMIYAQSTPDRSEAELAVSIRKAINRMNQETIPMWLYQQAFMLDAQRCWQFFGGRHFVTVTSWLNNGIGDVDFTGGDRLRFVEGLMPPWILQLVESRYGEGDEMSVNEARGNGQEGGRAWWSTGVDISINLEDGVAEEVVKWLFGSL